MAGLPLLSDPIMMGMRTPDIEFADPYLRGREREIYIRRGKEKESERETSKYGS